MFSVITPVLNGRRHLPRCVASVHAQPDAEHVVVDGASNDGTVEWLRDVAPTGEVRDARPEAAGDAGGVAPSGDRLRWLSAPNRGMYDALNRGIELSQGEWIGFLNADDQLLEGALAAIAEAARRRPEVDVWYGDCLVVLPEGRLLAWRRTIAPDWRLIAATYLYVPSSAIYVRRRVFESGHRFDDRWRSAADEKFVVELLRSGWRWARVDRPLSTFTFTGVNLSQTAPALEESRRLKRTYPWSVRLGRPLYRVLLAVRKILEGAWRPPRPLNYSVWIGDDASAQTTFRVDRPPWRWPGRRAAGGPA